MAENLLVGKRQELLTTKETKERKGDGRKIGKAKTIRGRPETRKQSGILVWQKYG